MLTEIAGTVFGRWYVTLFGITFVVLSVRQLGWRRTGIYAALAIGFGVLAENGSVRYGIPYTQYTFNPELRGKELFVGDVPLMVTLSYTFMAYFAFASARFLVGGPRRTRSPWPGLEFAVAVVLGVWALWVVDPVSRLGAHFFLGELFHYEGPGFWFGLPLGSQLGFAFTSVVLVGLLTWLGRDEAVRPVAHPLAHPHLPALGGYFGQVLFMTVTAFVVARTSSDPAVVQLADSLAGSTFLLVVPAALMTVVAFRAMADADRGATADGPASADTLPDTSADRIPGRGADERPTRRRDDPIDLRG